MKIKNLFSSSKSEAIDSRCLVCGLDEGCLSPRMPVSGKGEKSILILGEAPGKLESEKNTQWVGKAGQFLRKILKLYDINIDRDCWKTNAVACRPTKGKENRKPTKKEITFCRYRVLEAIKKYKPKYIMLFGGVAIESTLGYLFPKLSISKIHGYVIPIQEYNAWVLPIYHPSFVMRNEKDENLQSVFKRDIKNASDFIKQDREVPQYDYVTNLDNDHLLLDIQDVRSAFKQILKTKKETAFDYETTGTKPFIEGQKITSMAISTEFGTYAFPVDYQTHWNDKEFDTITNLIIEYLTKDSIYKVCHNAKFEKMWSQEIFGTRPKVDWCTMDTQHIIDHRRGITSLKFQAFIRWGIHGYDRLSKAYIKSGSGSSFNRMDEMPLGNQLLYVSLDAKLTRELFFEQKKQITKKLEPGRKLFLSTSDVFLDMQMNGLVVDEEHYKTSDKDLTEKIDKLTKQIAKAPEVLEYNKGSKKTFSETSPKDLQELLFNQMKIVSTKKTAGGGKSVDAEVLKDIDHQIPRDILLKRKYLKLRDTYLAQFLRECTDGFMHPNFTLNMARSLRSSCGQPSFQNIPKRDKESNLICRKGIIPSVGCRLLESDFAGIEVSTSAIYHKDPVFINYLISDDADMHRDLTLQLWGIAKEQITKELRFFTKNCWVFPQFYGDFFGSCANALWKMCVEGNLKLANGTPLITHLRKVKMHTLEFFTKHCQDVEDDMWNRRFKVYTEWKDDINDFYQRHGFVETFFGFQFTDYLNKRQATNYPIQSTATHLLFWCLCRLQEIAIAEDWRSCQVGQIHDSQVSDTPDDEVLHVIKTIDNVCSVELTENFEWIDIPMKVDFEISKLREDGGNFADMEEYVK